MRSYLPLSIAAIVAAGFCSGCGLVRFKGVEGFNAATTEVDYAANRPLWNGDKYASGGIAKGSGGTITKTNYGLGADENATTPVNPRMDQPEKGIGQQAGEYHADHSGGYGLTNGPVAQSTPSDANSIASQNGAISASGGH